MTERTIWRLLDKGEKLIEGDEERLCDGNFRPISGLSVGWPCEKYWVIRRRFVIPTYQYPTPRYDDPAKCGDPERMILELCKCSGPSAYYGCRAREWAEGSAWLEQPPVPVAQKSPAEIAWEKTKDLPWNSNKEMFILGFNIAKGTP